ncbi:bifunctional adenosylcobinamide kinase/adenosylcobinamide-phosphate guanylyltransferase [Parathalassolituus penaei]|mgnify:CR=1 FL=1|uniref:Bifunctional adenosylcobalamin biosynthesis protein n=1 Tax=Parathalassolituus penaei TaxID=2997323 RepID=A0A9X3ELU5_9GAMM|nr:bifunctional adenosylcobinamide kinase/adenosylcobinamide-phosphate guanylyltransferase [Parathalassolituus penaei]MCY0966736.1 bifunctional adenosylcobinamide kinase/adenosylcobinamide-phosphate guanylyltransferase [Parathalassolituus penaei]
MIHLVLGGARSGKSRLALNRVLAAHEAGAGLPQSGEWPRYFVATATILDDEMNARIERHRQERDAGWTLAEVPLDLVGWLREHGQQPGVILVDCLTLWLNNQLYHFPDQDFPALFADLLDALRRSVADVWLVSNEVGLGIIPMGEITRRFVDEAGRLNQTLAAGADTVTLVVAGLPLALKG